MSDERPGDESLADIVREMRGQSGFSVPYAPERAIWLSDFRSYADRIEAAAFREKVATATIAAGKAINLTDDTGEFDIDIDLPEDER